MHRNILVVDKILTIMGIYKRMEDDWKTYCLMSAVAYIEEMSKPTPHPQIKKYKDKKYLCNSFHTIRLKMKSKEFPERLFQITKIWEKKKGVDFVGKSFKKIRKEDYGGQYKFELNPAWINQILYECGKIPNNYSFETAVNRIDKLIQYKKIPIDEKKLLFDKLLKDKFLAAGAFLVSMDLECKGIQAGRPTLCMSEKFKDFLEFMLKVGNRWNWTTNSNLSIVDMTHNRDLGIKASSQYQFNINKNGLKEIYELAGPLCDIHKDNCLKFHINRSINYINKGYKLLKNNTKEKVIKALKEGKNTTTKIQFDAGVGQDVILDHLHKLEKEGKVKKERDGKRYIWSLTKCR